MPTMSGYIFLMNPELITLTHLPRFWIVQGLTLIFGLSELGFKVSSAHDGLHNTQQLSQTHGASVFSPVTWRYSILLL